MRKALALTALSISFGFGPYAAAKAPRSAPKVDSVKRLEERIQRQLEKRALLVQNNPLYLKLVSELNAGREQLKRKKLKEAFETFGLILRNQRYTSFAEYSFSKYYLATTMEEMGVYYGALLYYVDIVEKEPLRMHTHQSLENAIRIAQKLKDDELILYLASVISEKKVPRSLREEFRYFIAKNLYKKKSYKRSVKLLRSITHTNRLYLAAQYLLGAIAVETKNLKRAVQFNRNIANNRSPVDYYEEAKIRQLAHLALGRLFYENRNFPLSIVYYKKVDRDSEYYPQALYESSWALFKLNKYNEALSVLHSTNSPFFEQVFFLKSFLLKGAVFLELCLYDDALRALVSVEKDFEKLSKDIETFARRAKSPKQYYPLLSSRTLVKRDQYKYTYKDLFNLASAGRDFWSIHKYIRELNSERDQLKEINQSRANIIANLILQKERELVERASWLAGKKMIETRSLIQDFFALRDFLRYEIISTERKILQTRSLRLAPPVKTDDSLIKPKFTESLRESLVWWEYSGEYWEDEVGYYLYNLNSICKDKDQTSLKKNGR